MKARREVLVTGGCGLIGSHLIDALLSRGERVAAVDDLSFGKLGNIARHRSNPDFRFVKLDICDFKKLSRAAGSPDRILHMAAVKKVGEGESSLPTLRVNAAGAQCVLDLARRLGAKIVVGSTSDVYGVSEDLPFREDGNSVIGASTARRWAYAVSKLYLEHLALAYHKDFGVPAVVLRYFGTFGERSSTGWSGGHVPMFIDAVLRDRPVIIHGDGRQTRSMAHISDVVRGTLLALDRPKAVGEIINIGGAEEVSVLESAKIIHRLAATGRPLKLRFVPIRKVFGSYREIARRRPDLSKARRLLGYRPTVTFRDAVSRVIAAMRTPR